jgi:hypothetical protein
LIIFVLILALILNLILVKPLFSKILRALAIIILILIVLNPKITTYEYKKEKIAFVFDLTKSSKWLLEFYKNLDTKNFDKYELGDSIYKFKNFEFKYNITNLNALSYLKNYDKIIYVGDGWHNYPAEIDYNSFFSPIYVIYPNVKTNEISIKNFIYPKFVEPNEIFQTYLEVFSNKDTAINFQIELDTIIKENLNLSKGINSFTFILKAPNFEGNYKIILKVSDKVRQYSLNVRKSSKQVLINVYKITPEIGLLNRLLKDLGYDVVLNLKNEKITGNFELTIGYGKDNGEDLVFIEGKKKFVNFKGIDSVVDFKLDEFIISPISGIHNNRVFVLTDELWKIGRFDFLEYKNLLLPIISTAFNLKPKINIEYHVVFNKAYLKVGSNNPNVKFYLNNKEISNYNVIRFSKPETLNLNAYLGSRKIYENKITLIPDTLGFENEEGIDSLTLANIVNRTGGKFIKSINDIKLEKIKIQKEIFNNLFFGFLAIFLILIDFVLRRFFGFR